LDFKRPPVDENAANEIEETHQNSSPPKLKNPSSELEGSASGPELSSRG
jgi:hypothetical protein